MSIKIPSKLSTKLVVFLAAVVAISVIGAILDARDPILPEAEDFLKSSEQVRNLVGNVRSYSLHNRVYSKGSDDELPYRKYLFISKAIKRRPLSLSRRAKSKVSNTFRLCRFDPLCPGL